MRHSLIFSLALVCCSSTHAQINELFDGIKKRVEKSVTQRKTPDQKKNQAPATALTPPNGADSENDESTEAPQQQQAASNAQNEELQGAEVVKRFRKIWCKSVDNSVTSKNDFKGIRSGDLCLAPDDLIIAIRDSLRESKFPYTWMTEPKVLTEGGSLAIDNVKAGDKSFFRISLLVDPFKGKAYLAGFSGLICAADPTNSLTPGNPLRKALDDKFGKPSLVYTEYDKIKAQIDDLDQLAQENKKRALTVEEAKKARDLQAIMPNLKAMAATADKNNVLEIYWDLGEKGPKTVFGATAVLSMKWSVIRDAGGCKVQIKDREDYGFALAIYGRPELVTIEEAIAQKNKTLADEKVKSAPAPTF